VSPRRLPDRAWSARAPLERPGHRGEVPEFAVRAEIGLALALDPRDEGRVEGVPLAAVPSLAEAAQLPVLSRGLFHGLERLGRPIRGVNAFGSLVRRREPGGIRVHYELGKAQPMKSKAVQALLAGSFAAGLLAAGCSHDNGPTQASAATPTMALTPTPASGSLAITLPLPGPVATPASTLPASQATWSDMEVLTYEQRSQFVADLSGLVRKLDGQIGSLNAKRAAMTADTKDWDIAMMDVTAARAYLAGLVSEVSRASPDTWAQEKDRVGEAWQKAEEACDKVRTSTTS
jgi:hypothetical protein